MSDEVVHLSRILELAASRHPDAVAVADAAGNSITFGRLDRDADRLATRLARWGVGRGDRVGLALPDSIEAVVAAHGIIRTGAAIVVPPEGGRAEDVSGAFARVHARAAVVTAEIRAEVAGRWPGGGPAPRLVVVGPDPKPRSPDAPYAVVLADHAPTPFFPDRCPTDPAILEPSPDADGRWGIATHSHAAAVETLRRIVAGGDRLGETRTVRRVPWGALASCLAGEPVRFGLDGDPAGVRPARDRSKRGGTVIPMSRHRRTYRPNRPAPSSPVPVAAPEAGQEGAATGGES